ncbi:hypothetical protein GOQ29_02240 [Clostridium sp. D2Q-14]|uniref:hypothetical protein n=1 Tax=Anaeromonas gelatinilytica TaxID=2683194 RepID=UPI00193B5858|nr:hypothetical protein [Anaeromonas gelatinilytica]MBS4534430.1 hypothetical protein [Anaeromonas gelatinilytica]
MIKKILSLVFTIFILGNIYNTSYAIHHKNPDDIKIIPNEDYNIARPQDYLVTKEDTVLVSGKAKENSKIYISVYSLEDLLTSNKSLSVNKLLFMNEDPIITKEADVGELERYNVELELPIGRNNIIIEINNGEDNYVFNRNITITNEMIAKEYLSNKNILRDRDIIKIAKLRAEKN